MHHNLLSILRKENKWEKNMEIELNLPLFTVFFPLENQKPYDFHMNCLKFNDSDYLFPVQTLYPNLS